ncbi:MAG: hypothetical protein OEX19_10720 [Gammaproteobacteria bacterium]|nr:hypothetical protein [Gammaproteobacteria bacterium]
MIKLSSSCVGKKMKKDLLIIALLGIFSVSSPVFASQAYKKCSTDATEKRENTKEACGRDKTGRQCRKDADTLYKKEKAACAPIMDAHRKKMMQCQTDLREARLAEMKCQSIARDLEAAESAACFMDFTKHRSAKKRDKCIMNIRPKVPEFNKKQQQCIADAAPKVKSLDEKCSAIAKE